MCHSASHALTYRTCISVMLELGKALAIGFAAKSRTTEATRDSSTGMVPVCTHKAKERVSLVQSIHSQLHCKGNEGQQHRVGI